MGTYRKEWHCCDSVTETEGYEPESCPFCTECTAAPASTVLTDERVEIKDTDAARAYLLQWMVANFPTDQSFGVYIQTQLAGDFAYQLARALAATPVAAQAGQVAVPEGWKLVPEQPTHPMVAAGGRAQLNADIGTQSNSLRIAKVAYAAMLAAAPSAPAVAQQAPAQAAPVPVEPIECWSHNEEDFNALSLTELVSDHELQPGATVWVGEAVHPEPGSLFNTDWLIESMGEAAYDIGGEHAGGDYPNVSDEQVAELEALIVGWIAKCAPPNFWTVKNVRAYVLTAEDCGAQASTAGERQEGGA